MPDDMIEVENVNTPGRVSRVNRVKYEAMKSALLAVIGAEPPGTKVADLHDALRPSLPQDLFPGGATSGWWLKSVQLDLEAKGILTRADKPPVRLWRSG